AERAVCLLKAMREKLRNQPLPVERVLAVDVVADDCGYGYVAHVLMSDGTRRFVSSMKPTKWEAKEDTMDRARESARKSKEAADSEP
ncbi:hypothetical protein, partial [Staphylococcus aureus]|uniref:hypothetical protein n=1 Tax=Staphylococcus aureus TaxID=1280 RepID=UPI0039BDE772